MNLIDPILGRINEIYGSLFTLFFNCFSIQAWSGKIEKAKTEFANNL
jgi:hypothetical protein